MKRITEKISNEILVKNKNGNGSRSICYGCDGISNCTTRVCNFYRAMEKLVAYEDTGLEPKEIKEALEKQLNGGWISVKERLPERIFEDCLITTEKGEIYTSEFYGYGEECQGFKEYPEGVWQIDQYGEKVIAWRPLPELYKEIENDEDNFNYQQWEKEELRRVEWEEEMKKDAFGDRF